MVGVKEVDDIKKVFDEKKNYSVSGRDLNVCLAALDIPICPSIGFIDLCIEVGESVQKAKEFKDGKV